MTALTITNTRIFTALGDSDDLIEGAVHLQDGHIVRIADPGATQDVADEQILEGRGRVVIPGLLDAHFHAYGIGLESTSLAATPMSYTAHKAAERLERALRRGFTTVRDVCGGDPGLRRAIEEGLVLGPRYLYTGRALSQTGGHGDVRSGELEMAFCCDHMCEVVDGVDAVRTAVRDRFRRGAHAIKMMTSGGVVSLTDPLRVPQYSADEVAAATEEAARRGSYVAAHSYSPESIQHSVANGVRSIEHGNLLDQSTAELMAAHDAYLVPTLVTYDAMNRRGAEVGLPEVGQAKNLEVLHAGGTAIEHAMAAGVPVGFGTDLMGDLEDEQLAGLRLQHEVQGTAGVIRAATIVNSALFMDPTIGRIAEGAVADVLLLERDPFTEPDALWDPAEGARTVIARGAIVGG